MSKHFSISSSPHSVIKKKQVGCQHKNYGETNGNWRRSNTFRANVQMKFPAVANLFLQALDNPELDVWLKQTGDKYSSPEIQNKILDTLPVSVLKLIAQELQSADMFAVMAYDVFPSFTQQ